MAGPSYTNRVVVIENRFPQIAARLEDMADRVTAKTAGDIEARAKANVRSSGRRHVHPPADGHAWMIDTGALLNSIAARRLAPGLWAVEVGQEYGAYFEFGTRYMAADPFLFPAARDEAPAFYAAMSRLGGAA